jgi:hypothetical protein
MQLNQISYVIYVRHLVLRAIIDCSNRAYENGKSDQFPVQWRAWLPGKLCWLATVGFMEEVKKRKEKKRNLFYIFMYYHVFEKL